jgi:prevent-host-death family protein
VTIQVNIGEAKTRRSELIAAALRGEEVVLSKAGRPVARLVPETEALNLEREAIRASRLAMLGKHKGKFSEEELTIPDESVDEYLDRRFERKFGHPPPP